MRMILSKMVPFYGTITFACGWTKAVKKRNVWTRIFLETDWESLTEMLIKLTFASYCQLPMSENSFLLSFNFKRSLTNQSSTFQMHSHAHSIKGNALVLAQHTWTKRKVHLGVICHRGGFGIFFLEGVQY